MKLIHVLLCLILGRCIHAVETGCSRLPQVENADILDSSLKTNYTDGDVLHFACRVGYIPNRRIAYTCSERRWKITDRGKCSPKQCELPEDIANGYYRIVSGTDFVFGSAIKYACKEGYMLVGQSDTRLCMSAGWSDRVPSCEVVKCLAEINDEKMIVSGLGDDGSVSYGHILHFKCASSDETLDGEAEVTCLPNGTWSSQFPTCGGKENVPPQTAPTKAPSSRYKCGTPPIIPFGDIIYSRIYDYSAVVEYQCKSYYTLFGQKRIQCSRGEWAAPPTCLEPCIVTIEKMEQQGILLKYPPQRKLYVTEKDRVQFICDYGKNLVDGTLISHCYNGKMVIPSCK